MSQVIDKIEQEISEKSDLPDFSIGDSVKVHAKIREGEKERVQVFAGTVIARDGGGATQTFTVRRISHGVGVEKVFLLCSPNIAKIEIERSAHVRQAKLYFLRERTGKKARLRAKGRR